MSHKRRQSHTWATAVAEQGGYLNSGTCMSDPCAHADLVWEHNCSISTEKQAARVKHLGKHSVIKL